MKQRPILFSTPMVQAVLNKTKSQTRRLKGLDDINKNPDDYVFHGFSNANPKNVFGALFLHKSGLYHFIPCPFGVVGDVLWVREKMIKNDGFTYWPVASGYKKCTHLDKVIPSIHMPKEACRIWLQITDIKVERLQKITSYDAQWEGIVENGEPFIPRFIDLWNSINEEHNWNANPWVWVIEFKQIQKP